MAHLSYPPHLCGVRFRDDGTETFYAPTWQYMFRLLMRYFNIRPYSAFRVRKVEVDDSNPAYRGFFWLTIDPGERVVHCLVNDGRHNPRKRRDVVPPKKKVLPKV